MEGDKGSGRPGEKGAGGGREERGREAGFPRWRKAEEKITQHCTIFRNRKNEKKSEPTNTGREPGLKGTGSGRLKLSAPPPPPV